MAIYDKPTKELMREFVAQTLQPGQVFDKSDAVRWFKQHYPKIKHNTVQMHVEGMAINSTSRKHHPNIRPGTGHDLYFKVGPGKFRLWDEKTDPAPRYGDHAGSTLVDEPEGEEDGAADASREFAFERDLRNYLARNLGLLERGLDVYQDEEFSGVEFPVGGRFIDILAQDTERNFVVIELKVSRGYDRVVGQLLRYMAWVEQNIASGKPVRGFIVASDITNDLKLASSMIPRVSLFRYELALKLLPVDLR